jgi:membrane-associated phospholipid phosphatase
LLQIYWESGCQQLIVDHQLLIDAFDVIYIYGHWPVIVPVAFWLFLTHHKTYVMYRNAFFLSGIVGLALFLLVPVAPPRLADVGLVDTVTLHSEGYRVLQPPALVNQYAAFPSLHFGWNLLVGIVLATHAKSRMVRVFGLVLPSLMAFAVVATANHFILDVVAGAAISLAALGVSQVLAVSLTRDRPLGRYKATEPVKAAANGRGGTGGIGAGGSGGSGGPGGTGGRGISLMDSSCGGQFFAEPLQNRDRRRHCSGRFAYPGSYY